MHSTPLDRSQWNSSSPCRSSSQGKSTSADQTNDRSTSAASGRRPRAQARHLPLPWALLGAVALLLTVAGCAREPRAEPEFETVTIGGKATDNLRPDDDATEARRDDFGGQLPDSFPSDLPVPPSSSVVGKGTRTVTFGTEDSAANVRIELDGLLARAGWTTDGSDRYSKDGRSAMISLTEDAQRTLIRYQY